MLRPQYPGTLTLRLRRTAQVRLAGRALLPPGVDGRVVVVRDDEPTSLIAYALSMRCAPAAPSMLERAPASTHSLCFVYAVVALQPSSACSGARPPRSVPVLHGVSLVASLLLLGCTGEHSSWLSSWHWSGKGLRWMSLEVCDGP